MNKSGDRPDNGRPIKTNAFLEEEESDVLRGAAGIFVWGLVCAVFWLAVAFVWWKFG